MRINDKLVHNLDNEEIVIMDESSGAEIRFTPEQYFTLLHYGHQVVRDLPDPFGMLA